MSPHRSGPVAELAHLRGEAGAPHPTRAETERERAMMSDQNTTFPLQARPTETPGRAMRALADDEGAATAHDSSADRADADSAAAIAAESAAAFALALAGITEKSDRASREKASVPAATISASVPPAPWSPASRRRRVIVRLPTRRCSTRPESLQGRRGRPPPPR